MLSLTDFMGWRFGYVAKSYVVLLCMFNMAIGAPAAPPERGLPSLASLHGQRGWQAPWRACALLVCRAPALREPSRAQHVL